MYWRKPAAAAILAMALIVSAAAADVTVVDCYADSLFHRSGLPVVAGDRIAYASGFGGDGKGGPVTPDTPFILGSASAATARAVRSRPTRPSSWARPPRRSPPSLS